MKRLFVVGLGLVADGMTLEAKKSAGTVRSNLRLYRLCGFDPGRLSGEGISGQRYDKRSRTLSYGAFGSAGWKNAAMICSGDAGVYGMAGLVLSLAGKVSGDGGCDRCGA